ncbi:MAG: PQQ-dependent sugar dehydrogenase [Verrucomicrobia bacterium]|nr:PQQ-dependent sugar dehydrogenase [Verrucomicrobiota bacterium]
MKCSWRSGIVGWVVLMWLVPRVSAGADAKIDPDGSHGIETRVPWTTSRVIGSDGPAAPYGIRRTFSSLSFTNPVEMVSAPGSDRLFVAELGGRIVSFPNDPAVDRADLFFDASRELKGAQQVFGLAFHPEFQRNRQVYLCYVVRSGLPDGSRVSRFTVTQSDPPRIDPASEVQLITWLSGGHNGGSLKFGPDGFLYISTGDTASPTPPDPLNTGQDTSDLLSSILRIDVDHADPGRAYRVPPDNPFVGVAGSRPEIWAYGFRNPWRMSFDRLTGELWVGDVGWELWELVFRVERGGNYGWSIVEGPQSINPNQPRGPTPILPPVQVHAHSEAASVTGGYVYRGSRLPELKGAYVYGDWVTGKIWALRSRDNRRESIRELVDSALQIICFGEDADGELYVVDYAGGIYELEPTPPTPDRPPFPRQLSETGLFEGAGIPAPGVVPFFVNAEMWSDHAKAERFVALPRKSVIQTNARDVWLYQSKNEWRYPTNAVLAKTLSLEMESGNVDTLRRVETQLLHYDGMDWRAYSYRWNQTGTDAVLVEPDGAEETFKIRDSNAPGGIREQPWRFHSRMECLRCHNPWVNYALGFTAPQLNRDVAYRNNRPVSGGISGNSAVEKEQAEPSAIDNQLRVFSHLGFFDQPHDARVRPRLVNPSDPRAEISERARSWLHVNCAHCHREGAGGAVVSHFDYDTSPAKMQAIGQVPSQGDFGLLGAHVITGGDPYSSTLFYRISTSGQGRMPRIGSRLIDEEGVQLMREWIAQMPSKSGEPVLQRAAWAGLRREDADRLTELLKSGSDEGRRTELMDQLLETSNGALALQSVTGKQGEAFVELAAGRARIHSNFQVRDLFERFLPPEQRVQKLGANVQPEIILGLRGDAARGRTLFFQEGTQCSRCHRIGGQGVELGPDLSTISKKLRPAQILEAILFPSRVIDPGFVAYQVETRDDLSYSGFVIRRTDREIVLKDASAREIRLPVDEVRSIQAQPVSVMPELLLQDLTAQDAADLLAFLSSQ